MDNCSVLCSCGRKYQVPTGHAGKTFLCKACGERLRIETATDSEPGSSEPAAKNADFFATIGDAIDMSSKTQTAATEASVGCPKCRQLFMAKFQMATQNVHCPECNATLQATIDRGTGKVTKVRFLAPVATPTSKKLAAEPLVENQGGAKQIRVGLMLLIVAMKLLLVTNASLTIPIAGVAIGRGLASVLLSQPDNSLFVQGPFMLLGCAFFSALIALGTYLYDDESLMPMLSFLVAIHCMIAGAVALPSMSVFVYLVGLSATIIADIAILVGLAICASGIRSKMEALFLVASVAAGCLTLGGLWIWWQNLTLADLPDVQGQGAANDTILTLPFTVAGLSAAAAYPLLILYFSSVVRRFAGSVTARGLVRSCVTIVLPTFLASCLLVFFASMVIKNGTVAFAVGFLGLSSFQTIGQFWTIVAMSEVRELVPVEIPLQQ